MGADDRRIARRLPLPDLFSTVQLGPNRRAAGRVEDLSPAGARIRLEGTSDAHVRPGDWAEMEVRGIRSRGRVVWSSAGDEGPRVGLSFSEPLSEFATIIREAHPRA